MVYRNTTNQGILALYMKEAPDAPNLGPAHTSHYGWCGQVPWALKGQPKNSPYGHTLSSNSPKQWTMML